MNVILCTSKEYRLIKRALLEAEKNHYKSSFLYRNLLNKITEKEIPPIPKKYPLYAYND